MNPDEAMFLESLPVNSIPFAVALDESLKAGNTFGMSKHHRLIWMIACITHGQFAVIPTLECKPSEIADLPKWRDLNEYARCQLVRRLLYLATGANMVNMMDWHERLHQQWHDQHNPGVLKKIQQEKNLLDGE